MNLSDHPILLGELFDKNPDGILIADIDTKEITAANPALSHFLGYSQSDLTQLNLKDIFLAHDLSALISEIIELTGRQKNLISKVQCLKNDGLRVNADITGTSCQINGRTSAILFFRPLGALERSQTNDLSQTEERFRTLANGAPVLIWVAGIDKLCNWFNQVWLDFTGRTMDQEVGNGWAEGVHPDDFEKCLNTYITCFDQRLPFAMEYRLRKADGQYAWILDKGTPFFEAGVFKGYIGSCTDITEIITARAELDHLFSVSPDLVCVADTNGFFRRVNPSFGRVLGYTDHELKSQTFMNFVHPEDQASTLEEIAKLEQGQVTLHFENRYRTKSGDYRILNWVTQPDPNTGLLYAIARDVTEKVKSDLKLKATELQLVHSAKLASVGTLAAGVAHEINNPLAIISGNCDLISIELKKNGGNEKISSCLVTQKKAIGRAVAIINELRTFARADNTLNQVIDAHKAINSALVFCEPIFGNEGVQIFKNLRAKNTALFANEGMLQQVILNLLSNAKHACENQPKGGTITIDTSDDDSTFVLKISDNGIGIGKEEISKIFDPFFTTKEPGKGTGLGLSISLSIVESFFGTLTVNSSLGIGTTFCITIPLEKKSDPVVVENKKIEKNTSAFSLSALVVDDEEDLVSIYQRMLENMGMNVTTAVDSRSAFEILKKTNFDFVLTDKKMPHLDGIQLIEKALSLSHLARTSFVIMSGDLDVELELKSKSESLDTTEKEKYQRMRSKIHGYLKKPFDSEALAAILKNK